MARKPWQMAEVSVPLYLKGPQSARTVTFVFYTFLVCFLQSIMISSIGLNTPTSVLGRIDSKIVGNGFPICNKDALLWVTGLSFSFWSTRELFFACFLCLFLHSVVVSWKCWIGPIKGPLYVCGGTLKQNKTSQLEVSWVLKIAVDLSLPGEYFASSLPYVILFSRYLPVSSCLVFWFTKMC